MDFRNDGIPEFKRLPYDVYFRHQELEPARWVTHSHPWGQLNYVARGTLNLEVGGKKFLSPPQYAVWIPPLFEHASWNNVKVTYRTVYIDHDLCEILPRKPCALEVPPILKAILDEFARIDVRRPQTLEQMRLSAVVIDQIQSAAPINGYLPFASTNTLQEILEYAKLNVRRAQTTEAVAVMFNMTARTLERRCRSELGLGFGAWRQRLRFTMALEALSAGRTIQQISYDLGYSSPSAFIAMFRRVSGQTPEQYRRDR